MDNEAFRLALRREHDLSLEAELDFCLREMAALKDKQDNPDISEFYFPLLQARIKLIKTELARREVLAQAGGPPLRRWNPLRLKERMDWVREHLTIVAVADLLNVPPVDMIPRAGRLRFRCPVHGDGTDRDPSGVFYINEGRWWCFGCSSGGSMFDMVQAFRRANSFLEALEWLESFCPRPPNRYQRINQKAPETRLSTYGGEIHGL